LPTAGPPPAERGQSLLSRAAVAMADAVAYAPSPDRQARMRRRPALQPTA
jgi:hypothetical protein